MQRIQKNWYLETILKVFIGYYFTENFIAGVLVKSICKVFVKALHGKIFRKAILKSTIKL